MGFFLSLVITSIGTGYFVYGKKRGEVFFLVFGLVLMFYAYFVPNLVLSSVIGVILLIGPFLLRRLV